MDARRLPLRIAGLMAGTTVVLLLTVAISLVWMSRALDRMEEGYSVDLAGAALDSTLKQVSAITLDYAKWDAAVQAVANGDESRLYNDLGISATAGLASQIVVVWGGGLPRDIGWRDDGATQGRPGLLGPEAIRAIERSLANIPLNSLGSVDFFIRLGTTVYAISVSRIELVTDGRAALPDAKIGRLAMGRRLSPETLGEMGAGVLLNDLAVTEEAPAAGLWAPLPGPDGKAVAYLTWRDPSPGTDLLRRMAPLNLLAATAAVILIVLGAQLTYRSFKDLVLAENRASRSARTDALTGLPNRTAVGEILALPARAGERAILFMDLNGFKGINDTIGHAAGDAVVARIGERLRTLSGPDAFLARVGGDEFIVVVLGPAAEEKVQSLAQAIAEALETPIEALGHRLRMGASIGVAVQTKDDTSGEDLVRQADLAMYEAKRNLSREPVAFGEMIDKADRDARSLEWALRRAIQAEDELSIVYQPITELGARQLARAEALARWTSPELGPIGPDRFIAVAEQAGLIVELGQKLFRLICDDLERFPDLTVSFNVSPLQLLAPSFVPDLIEELAQRHIDPARIEIELTERIVVGDPKLASERLAELHAAGFSIALDDFGTGYSSIGYLRQMGFDTLKIDRSFVSGLEDSPERRALVDAMIQIAHALHLRVVCEGIETAEELALLRELGCDLAQGYHLDRPVPIDQLIRRWGGAEAPQAAVA